MAALSSEVRPWVSGSRLLAATQGRVPHVQFPSSVNSRRWWHWQACPRESERAVAQLLCPRTYLQSGGPGSVGKEC